MTGEGFTPNSVFTVTYLGFVLVTGTTTDDGSLIADFVVPLTALRGTSNAVLVEDQIGLLAITDHLVPRAAITLSNSEVFAGETITITGIGFPTRFPPSSITFSSFPTVQLTTSSPTATDGHGEITVEVQVPWPDRSGDITLGIGGIEAQASIIIKPAAIEATRQDTNTILVEGEGFPPNSLTRVSVDILVKIGPNVFSDEKGNFSFEITTIDDLETLDGIVTVGVGEFTASAQIK